jgi:cytochrome c biogenesis protein CcmG/thiol:disulfide interchange protein DsbE
MRFGVVCVLALVALASPVLAKSGPSDKKQATAAPSFTLPTPDGTVCLDSLRGNVVYVDFWASWCGPCKQSFPWMKSLHDRLGPKGLVIVAVNLDKSRSSADHFLEQFHPAFTVAFDPTGKTAKAYKVWGMPMSYVVGPTGNILAMHPGFDPKHTAVIEAEIQGALPQ